MFLGRSCAGIMADIFFFLLVIAVSFIHYWYSFFSVSACFRFLSADFQSDLLQHRKTLTHTSANFSSAWFAFCLSSTCLSEFLLFLALRPWCGETLLQAFFLLHLSTLPHRSPSFPPFPVDGSPASLLFQNHPSIPSVRLLLLPFQLCFIILFIPLFFHLPLQFSCSLAKSFEVLRSSRNFFSCALLSSNHSSVVLASFSFLLHCSCSFLSVHFILIFPESAFSIWTFFFIENFFGCCPFFSPICSIFCPAVGASLTV